MNRLLPLLITAALCLSACGGAAPAADSAAVTPASLPSAKVVTETESCVELLGSNDDGPLFVAIEVMKEFTTGEDTPSEELKSKIRDVSEDLTKISSTSEPEIKEHTDAINEPFVGFLTATGTKYEIKVEGFKSGASDLLDRCPALTGDSAKSTPAPTPLAATYSLTCKVDGKSGVTFSNYKDAWVAGKAVYFCSGTLSSGEPSALEKELGVEAGGDAATPKAAISLNALCAETDGYNVNNSLDDKQVRWVRAAMKLCPDHPKRVQLEANAARTEAAAAKKAAAAAEVEAKKDDQAAGKLVGPGKYLVGTDVQPGVWQSQGAKVEDCYWETSDASGNIIENNFISIAPQFTIRIPVGSAGFTASNCSFRWISD